MAATLDLAITAIRSQRQEEGRQLLNLLIQENPNNEMAWLWMSSVVDTDEQRARCLYHVLAINPDSNLARRGLEKLGIMVSDSRPVKVPRDSQPIRIPRPSPPGEATPLPPISKPVQPIAPPPKPESPPEPQPEPEIPSKPEPEPAPVPEPETPPEPEPIPEPEPPSEPEPEESKPPPPKQRPFRIDPQTITDELPFIPLRSPFGAAPAAAEARPEKSTSDRSQPEAHPFPELAQAMKFPPQTNPESEEKRASGPQEAEKPPDPIPAQNGQIAEKQSQPPDEAQTIATPAQNGHTVAPSTNFPRPDSGPMAPYQYPLTGPGMLQETRPTQPAIASSMPLGYYHSPHPSEPVPAVHSNMTMGMSTPYPQYHYSQPVLHSNTTMMMGPTTLPSEPVTGGSPYWQQGQPLNPPPAPKPAPARDEPEDEEEEEGEEVNLLAVIIFGSLSVTALGGLGMLILLMFTTV